MEIIFSAVLGEIATGSISFLMNKYSKAAAQAAEVSLERALLQAQVIVDEAAARHVANQGMLRQLTMLRDAMYRGLYVLDTFRHPPDDHEEGDHRQGSKFSYAKRICISITSSSSRRTQNSEELGEILNDLKSMILDVNQILVFLKTYPRLHRRPYDMHLLLHKCMFGRQMEMQLVINFLLHNQPACSSDSSGGPNPDSRFDVLPIVGPGSSGKSTLITHVCEDERVRDHFSWIVFFRHGCFRDEDMAVSRDLATTSGNGDGGLLVVVDIVGDLDEDLWQRLCSLCRPRDGGGGRRSGSKMIIASRSDKIRELGTTTQALTLTNLRHDAFWYFFKVITFGCTDPDAHPRLMRLAMEIAKTMHGNLTNANVVASLLRANFDALFWCKVLRFQRWYEQDRLPACLEKRKPIRFARMMKPSDDILVLDQYKACTSQEQVIPEMVMIQDVVFGSVRPHGVFKALVWRTRIPPFHSHIYTCEIQEAQSVVIKRKRSGMNHGV